MYVCAVSEVCVVTTYLLTYLKSGVYGCSCETALQVFSKLMLFTLLMIFIPLSTYFGSKHYVFEGEFLCCIVQ